MVTLKNKIYYYLLIGLKLLLIPIRIQRIIMWRNLKLSGYDRLSLKRKPKLIAKCDISHL
jgi:hypothetical protein